MSTPRIVFVLVAGLFGALSGCTLSTPFTPTGEAEEVWDQEDDEGADLDNKPPGDGEDAVVLLDR